MVVDGCGVSARVESREAEDAADARTVRTRWAFTGFEDLTPWCLTFAVQVQARACGREAPISKRVTVSCNRRLDGQRRAIGAVGRVLEERRWLARKRDGRVGRRTLAGARDDCVPQDLRGEAGYWRPAAAKDTAGVPPCGLSARWDGGAARNDPRTWRGRRRQKPSALWPERRSRGPCR